MFPGYEGSLLPEIATAGFQPVRPRNAPEIKGDFYAEFSVVKDQPSWAPTVRIGNGGSFDARRRDLDSGGGRLVNNHEAAGHEQTRVSGQIGPLHSQQRAISQQSEQPE